MRQNMNKKIIAVLIILAVLIPAIVSNVNATKQQKYKLMDKNAPATVSLIGASTTALITGITASERDVSGMFLNETGYPFRYMSVYYTVSYDDFRTKEIYYDEIVIPYDPIDITQNNAIKKAYIESHALDKWGWDMALQQYGYNKITPGNQ